MSELHLPLVKRGVFAIHDTGVPPGSGTVKYRTLVLLHGLAWHSDVFSRIIPWAQKHRCRLVLVNRRGYPGSEPFSTEELEQLASTSDSADGSYIQAFCRERAKEIHDFLTDFVRSEHISAEGGISLAGWSFGAVFAMIFLAYAAQIPVSDVDLRRYIRSVVYYDSSATHLDYAPPPNSWHPSSKVAEGMPWDEFVTEVFPTWVTSYFKHGDTVDTLEFCNPLSDPPPTLGTLPPSLVSTEPGLTGGCDVLFAEALRKGGMYAQLKRLVIYPEFASGDANGEGWAHVLMRHVWCEYGTWPSVQAGIELRKELDAARQKEMRMRPVKIVKMKGTNHFAHWDHPEVALATLLGLQDE